MNIDIAIVVTFLILTLVVGLGHGQKVKTIKDYALGGRNFSTGALVATIVATQASGSGFFTTLSNTYANAFYPNLVAFSFTPHFLLFVQIGFSDLFTTEIKRRCAERAVRSRCPAPNCPACCHRPWGRSPLERTL